ncbi:MAG: hypothetical protein WA971_05700 [Microbacterium sp.]
MGDSAAVVAELNRLMQVQSRSVAWVARTAELPYKRVLAEVKNGTSPIKLETAIAVASVLGTSLAVVIGEAC